jgi:hypothetical protein
MTIATTAATSRTLTKRRRRLERTTRSPHLIEPARLSHGAGASSANLPAFEPKALPPMLVRPDHSAGCGIQPELRPSWSSRTAEMVAARAGAAAVGYRMPGATASSAGRGAPLAAGAAVSCLRRRRRIPAASPSDGSHPSAPRSRRLPAPWSRSPALAGRRLHPGSPDPKSPPVAGRTRSPSIPEHPGTPGPGRTGPLDAPIGDPPRAAIRLRCRQRPSRHRLMLIGTGLVGIYGALRRRAL